MPLLTQQQISSLAVELLSRRLLLPNTVSRVPQEEFRGDNGATVSVRVPQARQAQEQDVPGADITYTPHDEDEAEVTVTQLYDAAGITDHDQTLTIVNYGRQILRPMTDAVARGAEDQLADVMNDLAADASFAAGADHDDTKDRLLEAREELTNADVPPDGRWMAVSPQLATRILAHPTFTRVDASGRPEALRRGILGELYGFTFVETNALNAGEAVAYHESAFAFATFPPVQLEGQDGDATSVVTEQGLSLRTIRHYNATKLRREQVVTCFAGAGIVDLDRTYKFDTAAA